MGLYSSKDNDLKERIEHLEKRLKELEKQGSSPEPETVVIHSRKMSKILQNDIKNAKLNPNKKTIIPKENNMNSGSLFLQLRREIEKRRKVINVQTDTLNDPDILFNTMNSYI